LRLGVLLNALVTIFSSVMMIFFKQYAEDSMRMFSGGYVLFSRVVIRFIEVTGMFWGIMGVLGAWNLREGYLEIYNMYQMVRVVSWLGMYVTDFPILWDCEMWMVDLNGAMKKYGWNPIVYKIALSGNCVTERTCFIIFSSLGLLFFVYLTWVNVRLQRIISEENKYLIRLPQSQTSGAFFQVSSGEKSRLLDMANDHRPGAAHLVGPPVRTHGVHSKERSRPQVSEA